MSSSVQLNDSQFNKWKTLVALAHVDGQVCQLERNFVRDSLEKRKVNPEQVELIMQGFETAEPAGELFEKITDPRDRATLLYLARLMFLSNNESFCDYEKLYYEKFKSKHMSTINLGELVSQVGKVEAEFAVRDDGIKRGSKPFRIFSSFVEKIF